MPEGLRVEDALKTLAKGTEIPLADYQAALKRDQAIGLPAFAKGNPEGYLFPATYAVPPNADAVDVLSMMVDRWRQAAEEADLVAAAEELGYTPGELMIVASLVESEANRDEDRGKVARVIYNRLETDETGGLLQIDATVNYALGRDLGLGLTPEDLDVDSPYNTRKVPGLPPGPIESPGDAGHRGGHHADRGPLALLRHGEPRHRRDQVHRRLRRVPAVQERRAGGVLRRLGPLLSAEDPGSPAARCWAARSPTRSPRCCTGRRTPSWGWTGPTTRSRWASPGWPAFVGRARHHLARAVADHAPQAHRAAAARRGQRPGGRWRRRRTRSSSTQVAEWATTPTSRGSSRRSSRVAPTALATVTVLGGGATAASAALAAADPRLPVPGARGPEPVAGRGDARGGGPAPGPPS